MAIIIEEEGKRMSIVRILMWLLILIIVSVAGYYIFFTEPELVEIVVPASFQNINPLVSIDLKPEALVSGQDFQSLKQYVIPPKPGNIGKPNPFAP